jgi:prepilin-type N-terminal cleavage/methylation domain-containing protein
MSRHHRRQPRARERGFTLLELLITLVVTTFGLMGTMALHASLTEGATHSGRSQEAVTIGTQVMETLRAARPAELATAVTGSVAAPPFSNPTYGTMLGRNGLSYSLAVDVTAPTGSLWRIRVEVSWVDDVTGVSTTFPFELLRTSKEAL